MIEKKMLWIIVPFCAVFIALGGWLTVKTTVQIWRGVAAASWPHTLGTITSIESVFHKNSDGDSIEEVSVRYSYEVGSQSFEGHTIHPAYEEATSKTLNLTIKERLQVGTRVRVYYQPSSPDEATLSVGFYSGTLPGVFGGLLFLGAGLVFLMVSLCLLAGNHRLADGIIVIP